MPGTRFQSPFSSSFRAAVRRGTPASTAVANIASRTKRQPSHIFESLFRAGQVNRQRVNGQWIYWPTEGVKANASTSRQTQWQLWQAFVDWAIASGTVTAQQISTAKGSQQAFGQFVRRFFGRQFSTGTRTGTGTQTSTGTRTGTGTRTSRTSRTTQRTSTGTRTTARTGTRRTSATSRSRSTGSLTIRPRTGSRRLRRAA